MATTEVDKTLAEMLDNGVLLRYREKELVGVTVLEASKRDI